MDTPDYLATILAKSSNVGMARLARVMHQQAVCNGQAIALQRIGHGAGDGGVVFEQQQAGRHGRSARDEDGEQLAQPVRHHLHRQRGQDQAHQAGHHIDAGLAQHTGNRVGQ